MDVTLEKYIPSPHVDKPERFYAGERMIMVDGVRWGRTRVSHHGCHGTKHVFEQEGGEVVIEKPDARYPQEVSVRSPNKRRRFLDQGIPVKTTLELVAEKAVELVASGKLRDPAVVLAERRAANERAAKRRQEHEAKERAGFEAKARDALAEIDHREVDVARVVAAMRWAQEQ